MSTKRLFTLLSGLAAGLLYAFFAMLLVQQSHRAVSMAFVFMLPLVLGAIPVLFSTREQLRSYLEILLMPWVIVLTFFYLSFLSELEGMICLVVLIGPFLILVSLGAFLFRLIKLRQNKNQSSLYVLLTLPFLFLLLESQIVATDYYDTVETHIEVEAPQQAVWERVKSVRNIQPSEIKLHFVHLIGVPRPLDGKLTFEGVGAERQITWEKGIEFTEKITKWNQGTGFAYDIVVTPRSIPLKTLDEHVMVGAEYFDVLQGSYQLTPITPDRTRVTLTCSYRITTTLNWYGKLWTDFLLDDFNEMILEVIKKRTEQDTNTSQKRKVTFQNGDLIFHISQSAQSKAIQLATHSPYSHCGIIYQQDKEYFVFEAVQPVKLTPLKSWIARGQQGRYVIKRLKEADKLLTPQAMRKLKQAGEKYTGKPYDLYFEWTDERIYCSELVWKVYKEALGIELGKLQTLKEFDLSSSAVKQKLKERYGKQIPLDEKVISPESIFNSNKLVTVAER